MRCLRLILAAWLLLIPAAVHAQQPVETIRAWELSGGQERILSFVSDVTIEPDGDLDVTETIRLVSLRQSINHGILRDFPTIYENGPGQSTRVGFSVISVQRDGEPEPWEQSSLSNGVRIRIGSAAYDLPPGEHTYRIRYRTTRQIAYGEDRDELYWNATGTGWTFPIDMAEARITLPSDAEFGERAAYTGPQGSTDRSARVVEERPGHIVFRTTRPLGAREGLTVAAAFPKGVVAPPNAGQRLAWWLSDWGALAAAVLSVIALAGYYFRAWLKAGRNPRAGPVVPLFTPPDGLSPAAMRFIKRMDFDNRAFSAAMVYLGVHGRLHIAQDKGGWFEKSETTLTRTDATGPDAGAALPAPEEAMHARLFASGDTIELKQKNHRKLRTARSALESGLTKAYQGTMFRKNGDWAVFGVALIVLAMFASALIGLIAAAPSGAQDRAFIPVVAFAALAGAWFLRGKAEGATGCLALLFWGGTAVAGMIALVSALGTIASAVEIGIFAVFIPLLMLPVAISAFWWMYAPTKEGRAVMDRIAGFEQYLAIAEESRLDTMHPPEKTPELFERYLPYAIALDVENRWAASFAGVLATAAAAGAAAHTASWYSGDGNMWNDPSGFASDIGSSFTSTVSSASTAPSSGGGSSGGGSSGGGGGGGGGSGW